MLSAGASNALLKTLEEPPAHVVFVLATTDPHKVLPTIRSRTQHFQLHLLPAEELETLVHEVVADADLQVDDAAIAYALHAGGGSARDTLSALDQVVAAGGVLDRGDQVDDVVDALGGEGHGRRVARGIRGRCAAATIPGSWAKRCWRSCATCSCTAWATRSSSCPTAPASAWSDGPRTSAIATCTRALEAIGEALREMRQATDTRIPLEVALVRLTRAEADASLEALAARVDRLERGAPSTATADAHRTAPPRAASPSPTSQRRRVAPGGNGVHLQRWWAPVGRRTCVPRRQGRRSGSRHRAGRRTAGRCCATASPAHHAAFTVAPRAAPTPAAPRRGFRTGTGGQSRVATYAAGRTASRRRLPGAGRNPSSDLDRAAEPGGADHRLGRPGVAQAGRAHQGHVRRRPVHRHVRCEGDVRRARTRCTARSRCRSSPRWRLRWLRTSGGPSPWSWWSRANRVRRSRRQPRAGSRSAASSGETPVGDGPTPPQPSVPADEIDEIGDPSELMDAPADDRTTVDRVIEAFPGAEVVDQ